MSNGTPAVIGSAAGLDVVLKFDATVADAVRAIESSSLHTAFVIDDEKKLVGLVTNGDVRRYMLARGALDRPVVEALNRHFRAVRTDAPREEVLRLFDVGYSVIPRLDEHGRFVDFLTPEYHHDYETASNLVVRARAPARISFAGGGTDLTYYFSRLKGLVLNAAIARYAVATLIPRDVPEIDIYAQDIGRHQHFGSPLAMFKAADHSLLSATASLIRPDFGFELRVASEFPVGSGLGGSSAVTTSVLAAFNELRIERWSAYEMAELAFQAERLCFKVPGGWQDQYAAAFGGFNLIEFMPTGNNVNALRMPDDVICELEESLILFNTGVSHDSGDLHRVQKAEMSSERGDATLMQLAEFCFEMNRALARRDLARFGRGLHEAWLLKKKTSSKVSSDIIDEIYDTALQAGAIGGKLLGAGGGGHILFYAPPAVKKRVIDALASFGCTATTVRFDLKGALSWRTQFS
ncbi:GHMP family kinase ATP-binding protein [Methylobacterium sp. A54F]